ncbi:SDR family oxidoreductase [Nonomuraea endophytica]|uniref:Uncharacterized protein YbjT (DUF2867 family) n=1 Tax=Nonomuraea endophytica TaxID=714136 RepID=A0A7W8EET2_9ACTN|nr:NAD(P)-binding oxidoreductase [Nonomuraea endophytica]MBB5078010.1 uncharacterized protein YbjT (DUF2867 family) [Nonomuraea endophytica]
MRIAVAGATGNIGALTIAALEKAGHEVVGISRSLGVDLSTGKGLDEALTGVEAVVDAISAPAMDEAETVAFFGGATGNLLAAEQRAGVRHHVLLSIAGLHRTGGNAHYAGKREQERLVSAGPVPWTIVPATQFHDFAATTVVWAERDGVATVAPLLMRPIAPADVAAVLAEVATGEPKGVYTDIAGPDQQDLVDMARRTYAARGQKIVLVPTWAGLFGPDMAGDVLLPAEGARIMPTTFEEWLAGQGPEVS